MSRVIGVNYEGSAKVYSYLAPDDLAAKLAVGDIAVAPVARGWGFAIVKIAKIDYPEGYEKSLDYKLKPLIAKLKSGAPGAS